MNDVHTHDVPSREQLVHRLYEAAELEHCLMCTYLYAAYSLRQGVGEGLREEEAAAVDRWRRAILDVAIEEMGHLVAVWNITSALGAVPRFGRVNFPLDPGYLPARLVVKLAPFNDSTLQHFIFLERPHGSEEPDGVGFEPERLFARGNPAARLTPMAVDYETVGEFYQMLGQDLQHFVTRHGEADAFCGDRGLQISGSLCGFSQVKPVICLKTALAAFDAIVLQGEGAPADSDASHYRRFVGVREEFAALRRRNPGFDPALPAATNPVLRRPPRPAGRVWLEDPRAIATVDLANAGYGLMLRLVGFAYSIPEAGPEKSLVVDLAIGLMRAVSVLAMHAARLPAGPSNPQCNAGVTFATLRDAAPLPPGPSGHRFIVERLAELEEAASQLASADPGARTAESARVLGDLRRRGEAGLSLSAPARERPAVAVAQAIPAAPPSTITEGIESVEGRDLTLRFEAKRCIHARFCVTGAPKVFLANVQGPWLHPDAMPVERLADIAHACPSGAITYLRKDGAPNEVAPPVNLVSIRESGPYAFRAALVLEGRAIGYRATLCRCGASRNKPFCDGSHADAKFQASGEPVTGLNGVNTEMPPARDGLLAIDPQPDGPLVVRGNLEIVSGTGRMVGRVTTARFCRCGGSATRPFCDNTHKRIGFKST
jgi:CDGSH-type Zn-finger protein/uncharacterized Fe-S cluster protein YjdI